MGVDIMCNDLSKLENVIFKLEQANSLIDCICENYFKNQEPNLKQLKSGYKVYANIIHMISSITIEQEEVLTEIVYSFFKLRGELKQTTENISTLAEDKVMTD